MNIHGKRIVLRAIDAQDLPLLHQWANDPELAYGLGDIHFPSSAWQQEQWFQRIQANENTVRLAIHLGDRKMIGYTGFWDIHWRDRRAEHATLIGDRDCRGQGYGREAIAACARYAFEEMDLFRLDATILETNTASLRSYQSCGFQIEGTLRGHALRGGRRVNRLILGLLAEDYATWARETGYWDEASRGG